MKETAKCLNLFSRKPESIVGTLRLERGMTMMELALKVGVSLSTMQRYERNWYTEADSAEAGSCARRACEVADLEGATAASSSLKEEAGSGQHPSHGRRHHVRPDTTEQRIELLQRISRDYFTPPQPTPSRIGMDRHGIVSAAPPPPPPARMTEAVKRLREVVA
jgi:hypothetical protein